LRELGRVALEVPSELRFRGPVGWIESLGGEAHQLDQMAADHDVAALEAEPTRPALEGGVARFVLAEEVAQARQSLAHPTLLAIESEGQRRTVEDLLVDGACDERLLGGR